MLVGYLAVTGLASLALALVHRWQPLTPRRRDRAALGLLVAALLGLTAIVATDAGASPEDHLFLAAAFTCAVASSPAARMRWSLQAVALLLVLGGFLEGGRSVPDTVFVLVLLLAVALLLELFARALVEARLASLRAKRDADNRAELLDAVRTLAGRNVTGAARAVMQTLLATGFHTALVARIEDGSLVPMDAAGDTEVGPLPRGQGCCWTTVTTGETSHESDLDASDPLRRATGARAAVVAPLRVDGVPVGCLVGGYLRPGVPSENRAETVEVLAAHLSGVLAADARRERQTELMERMAALDGMRRGLITAVSAEIRDPLTVVRATGQLLTMHGDRVDDGQRRRFLEQLVHQSHQLRTLIETLLDFSRTHAHRDDPRVRATPVVDLLVPSTELTTVGRVMVRPSLEDLARGGVTVRTDPELLRSALELLIAAEPARRDQDPTSIEVIVGESLVHLRIARRSGTPPTELVGTLVSQLCVSASATVEVGRSTVIGLSVVPDPARGPMAAAGVSHGVSSTGSSTGEGRP